MHPILLEFGFLNLKIFTYGLLVATGFFAGILLAARWAKQDGLDQQKILDLCFYIAIAALVGGRTLYIIVEYRYFVANPLEVLKFWKGGLVFLWRIDRGGGDGLVLYAQAFAPDMAGR